MKHFLRKLKLPNVVEFSLTDAVMNPIAYYHGYIKRDRQLVVSKKCHNIMKANRYLERTFVRMYKLVLKGRISEFDKVAQILLKKSDSFLILCFNRVNSTWLSMHLSKVRKLIKSVHKLRSSLATDIDYKRVWIDKKPGDYGRPLGVPKMDWRIYLLMVTLIGECFAYGKGYYSKNQHGGRAGYGVMTCLKDLAQRLPTTKYLYEFDLKGFFDHVSHDYIRKLFKGTFLDSLYNKMMKAKPKKFELPDIKSDKAAQLYTNQTHWTPDTVTIDMLSYPEGTHINVRDRNTDLKYPPVTSIFYPTGSKKVFNFGPVGLQELYKDAMDLGYLKVDRAIPFLYDKEEITETSRALGRDTWKDLDLPNQGVPQGSAFGPFLASVAVAHSLYKVKNLLMYIDDGMLFYQNKVSKFPKEFLEGLSRIGVEIHPEKCKITPVSQLNTKFLGMRFKLAPKNANRGFFTMSSETRAGTKRDMSLNMLSKEDMLGYLTEMLSRGEITISKYKYARWAVMKSKLSQFVPDNTIEMSIKYGFFGLMISWLYSPSLDFDDLKERINLGMRAAWERIKTGDGSIGQQFIEQQYLPYLDQEKNLNYAAVDLYNMSSIAVSYLLEQMHKGSVSRRLTFGLVNKSKDKRKTITTYAGTIDLTSSRVTRPKATSARRRSTLASFVPRTERVRKSTKAMIKLGEYYK